MTLKYAAPLPFPPSPLFPPSPPFTPTTRCEQWGFGRRRLTHGPPQTDPSRVPDERLSAYVDAISEVYPETHYIVNRRDTRDAFVFNLDDARPMGPGHPGGALPGRGAPARAAEKRRVAPRQENVALLDIPQVGMEQQQQPEQRPPLPRRPAVNIASSRNGILDEAILRFRVFAVVQHPQPDIPGCQRHAVRMADGAREVLETNPGRRWDFGFEGGGGHFTPWTTVASETDVILGYDVEVYAHPFPFLPQKAQADRRPRRRTRTACRKFASSRTPKPSGPSTPSPATP